MLYFWVVTQCEFQVNTNVSEEHIAIYWPEYIEEIVGNSQFRKQFSRLRTKEDKMQSYPVYMQQAMQAYAVKIKVQSIFKFDSTSK